MEVEYKKDLRHNYMIVKEDDNSENKSYSIKMLEHQTIEGILPVEQRWMDNKILFYYDITAKQSMTAILDKAALTYDKVKLLCQGIIDTVERAYEYLLPEDDFILLPEYIYIDVISGRPALCSMPGYQKRIKEQMSSIIEYLMNKVSYSDKEAVLLIYSLYAVSREEGYTFEHLIEVLQDLPQSNNYDKKKEQELTDQSNIHTDADRMMGNPYCEKNPINRKPDSTIGNLYHDKNLINRMPDRMKGNSYNDKNPINMESESTIQNPYYKKNSVNIKTDSAIGNPHRKWSLVNMKPKGKDKDENVRDGREGKLPKAIFDNFAVSDENIPVMMEKLEGEEEIFCYPFKAYLYTGGCIVGGVIITILSLFYKIIYNSFGNRIDYSKLSALIIILLCIEGYLLKLIWDKKNRITRMVPKNEYIDPRDTQNHFGDKTFNNNQSDGGGNQNHSDQNHTSINFTNRNMAQLEYQKENKMEDEYENDEPTCLLNAACLEANHSSCENTSSDNVESLILKPLDDVNYETIPITIIPFFIGKLKKNVDYCLEKDVVSRYHAKITKEDNQYFITDLNSTNGTFVNSQALQTYEKKVINIGDEIAFADIKYRFVQEK